MPKLVLKVLHARDLDAKDIGGTSDPFIKIKIGTLQLKTEIIKKNCNPDWNAVFNVDLPPKFDPEFDSIYFDVYDYDRFSSNDLIGKTSIQLNNLEKGKTQQETLNLHNSHKGTLTIELLAEDFGIIIEKDIKRNQSTVHNRSVSQLNYQQVNTTQPPQYFTDSSTPPPQYGQSSPLPPQYSNSNPPPQYSVDKFNSTATQPTQPPQYSTSNQPPPPQYQNQPPQYSEQCYPVMQNQNNQSFQGYPPVGYEQPPPSYPPQYNQ